MEKPGIANTEKVNAEAVMEMIRERARSSIGHAMPAAPHALHLESCRALAGYAPPVRPEIGSLPPEPPTWRGRIGAYGVRIVQRALFWYSGQLREVRNEELAWRDAATRAIGELSGIVLDLQGWLTQAEQSLDQTARVSRDNDERIRRLEPETSGGDEWPEALRVELERRDGHGAGKGDRRYRSYLPWVREAKAGSASGPVLDLGCGSGDWLALLRGEGLSAAGVDSNRFLV